MVAAAWPAAAGEGAGGCGEGRPRAAREEGGETRPLPATFAAAETRTPTPSSSPPSPLSSLSPKPVPRPRLGCRSRSVMQGRRVFFVSGGLGWAARKRGSEEGEERKKHFCFSFAYRACPTRLPLLRATPAASTRGSSTEETPHSLRPARLHDARRAVRHTLGEKGAHLTARGNKSSAQTNRSWCDRMRVLRGRGWGTTTDQSTDARLALMAPASNGGLWTMRGAPKPLGGRGWSGASAGVFFEEGASLPFASRSPLSPGLPPRPRERAQRLWSPCPVCARVAGSAAAARDRESARAPKNPRAHRAISFSRS